MKLLTVRRALAFQTECTAELQTAKRQEVLLQKFEAAGGDVGRQAGALKLVVVPALCEVVPRYGFDASYVGVCESLVSLLQRAAESAEVLMAHKTLAGLLCPPLKDEMPILDGTWAKACLHRMMCKGTDILAEYLASLFEFVQSNRQCPHEDDAYKPVTWKEEELSLSGKEKPPLTLQHVVDVQLDCLAIHMDIMEGVRSTWPELDQDRLYRSLKGMTATRCLALQEELLALLTQPEFQEQAGLAHDSASPRMQSLNHTVLAFPMVAPVLARYGLEVSVHVVQLLPLVMVFFHSTHPQRMKKQLQKNYARIATLLCAGVDVTGFSRSIPEVLQARKELNMMYDNLKAFRAALDAEPIRGLSPWMCIKHSGLAKTTPDLGSFPKHIEQGCLLQASEALPAPDGSLFLRLEDARGWVRAAGSGAATSGTGSSHVCCIRLAPRAGRCWQVVGGASLGGIRVRKGKELTSPVLGTCEGEVRLETGAMVCEIELVGERLHYSKVQGTGPDVGWLSIFFKGTALVRVADWEKDVPELLLESRDC